MLAFIFPKTWRNVLLGLMVVLTLSACKGSSSPSSSDQTTAPPPALEADPAVANVAAQVTAVEMPPVWIKTAGQALERDAVVGMELAYGDNIRTAEDGLTQIDLANGLAFRLGGEASLTLQPNQQLQLTQGDMLVWVEPGKQVPTEIITPVGVAGLRGTTLFVQVPGDPEEGVVFLAWEGTIRLRFEGDTEDLVLNSGEELQVRPGERLAELRGQVRRLRRREIRQQRRQSRLLNGFQQTLPTQTQLDQTVEAAP